MFDAINEFLARQSWFGLTILVLVVVWFPMAWLVEHIMDRWRARRLRQG